MQTPRPGRRRMLAAFGGLALLATPALAGAAPDDGGGARAGRHRKGICERLECTDAQREQLSTIVAELRKDTTADREAIRRLRGQLAAEFRKASPDEAALKKLYAEIDRHHDEIRERLHDALMEVHAILDAEQRDELARAVERRGVRALLRGHGHGRGPGKGKGKGKPEAAG